VLIQLFYYTVKKQLLIKNMADKNDAERTIAEDLVVTKYKMAGDIVNSKNIFNYVFYVLLNISANTI
jgi:hypothetical protein